eukprot:gnl/TRDRNA2_/TRDRNA2_89413_c1_seq1.p1 gnl/TRDRNA2_/TRDRNA2_89413_c1~~gnl/TRDRNA2_/TRDRNA2_89413_c1_seq1.p1  ORF type:complete len:168 (+),score=31.33 gnl/TRDRNA2_/TRDRNA2_89413_c1_seq1:81-584(+)
MALISEAPEGECCSGVAKPMDAMLSLSPNSRKSLAAVQRRSVPTAEVRAFAERIGYGRVPAYLRDITNRLDEERTYIDSLPAMDAAVEDPEQRPHVRLLTETERCGLLQGLMGKYKQVLEARRNDLDLFAEESWKVQVSDSYAPQLRQIDKDIENLSNRYIFISADA